MQTAENSLHRAVEKWLAPSATRPARVVRLCRSNVTGSRYVCIEAPRAGGTVVILFFRHDDGSWNVFPQQTRRPSMSAHRLAA
jgi:hypothetical protein